MRLELPFPPPAGSLYRERPGGGRQRSESYEIWRHLALWQLSHQIKALKLKPADRRPVALDIAVIRPQGRGWHLSELAPALEEILVFGKLISDRSSIQEIRLRWADLEPEARRLAVSATRDVRRHLALPSSRGPGRNEAPS